MGDAPLPTTPDYLPRLDTAATRARVWLERACFPFWAERAPHPTGGFRERVGLDGVPLDDTVSRVRVQARQTYMFARAAHMGWEPDRARALVEHGLASLLGPCRRDDGLVGLMVDVGVGLSDRRPELYDNAFALLALAWAARALDRPGLLTEADAMLARLDATHAHSSGGWNESVPARLPRRQNPHMHLFEASLALADASQSKRHLERATQIYALLETRFVDHTTGHLRELFDDDLTPVTGPAGDVIEPGHEFEWAALLHMYADHLGQAAPSLARTLYNAGLESLDPRGFAPMSTRLDGSPRDATRRTWSQTEALRAHIAFARNGDADAAERAINLVDAIFEVHLDPAPLGAWIDHYDADGRPCVSTITAATGYHIVTAFIDVIEATEHLSTPPRKTTP